MKYVFILIRELNGNLDLLFFGLYNLLIVTQMKSGTTQIKKRPATL
jgi:hypothetical protein